MNSDKNAVGQDMCINCSDPYCAECNVDTIWQEEQCSNCNSLFSKTLPQTRVERCEPEIHMFGPPFNTNVPFTPCPPGTKPTSFPFVHNNQTLSDLSDDYITEQVCTPCHELHPNCSSCSNNDNTGSPQCDTCLYPYMMTAEGNCECGTDIGFYVNTNIITNESTCELCQVAHCEKCGDDGTTCEKCFDNYFLAIDSDINGGNPYCQRRHPNPARLQEQAFSAAW